MDHFKNYNINVDYGFPFEAHLQSKKVVIAQQSK
jgi:hypothetical protein